MTNSVLVESRSEKNKGVNGNSKGYMKIFIYVFARSHHEGRC